MTTVVTCFFDGSLCRQDFAGARVRLLVGPVKLATPKRTHRARCWKSARTIQTSGFAASRRCNSPGLSALTCLRCADTVPGYLTAALMARIGTPIRAAATRMLVLGLALFLTLQGAMAGFAAVRSAAGCGDHAATATHADPGASGPLTAEHSHDHHAESADHRHDEPAPAGDASRERLFECCGWMCTAAICQASPDTLPDVPQSRMSFFWHAAPPPGWLALGLDRPPRWRIA